jgi:hypothetical protein
MTSREKKDAENRRGARDASGGRMRHDPWAGPFESHKDHAERRDAYNYGYDNTNRQRDRDNGICFLTTACVEFAGLPSDCRELTVLRDFRDSYVRARLDGDSVLRRYYESAPALVDAVRRSPEGSTVFAETLQKIRLAIDHIDAGRPSEAFDLYGATYSALLRRFLPPSDSNA